MTTIAAELRWAAQELRATGTAELDAELLLAHALGIGRPELLARLREELPSGCEPRFKELVMRRAEGVPIAYLTGLAHFYGLTLAASPGVLVPRPETEVLVSWGLDRARSKGGRLRALDVGTGCGAVALALASRAPNVEVYATDTEPRAVELATENARRLALSDRVQVRQADLFPPEPEHFDLVLANLPYVAVDDPDLEDAVRQHEPHEALFAGPDGLDAIRRLIDRLPERLSAEADVAVEIGWRQGPAVRAIFGRAFPGSTVQIRKDLAGRDRVVSAEGVG